MRIAVNPMVAPLAVLGLALAACAKTSGDEPTVQSSASPSKSADTTATTAPVAATAHEIVVHKSPSCGCCGKWIDHLRAEGFVVKSVDTDDLGAVKQLLGVSPEHASCHTATIAGYVVEGHVPAADIRRLLAEKPAARGLAVPGMPAGSPGMEVLSGEVEPYDTLLIGTDGAATVYSHHGGS
jgi:hypothetical protein